MTTEIFFSTCAQLARKQLADVGAALGVVPDIGQDEDLVKAYFPVLSGKRQTSTGCWVKIRPKLNFGPPPFRHQGVGIAVVLPEKILDAGEAALQGELLSQLALLLERVEIGFENYAIKDD